MQNTRFSWRSILAVVIGLGIILAVTGTYSKASEFTGIYVGGSTGLSNYGVELNYEDDYIDGLSAAGFNQFGIFAGTGAAHRNIYYGVEANLGIHNADFSSEIGDDFSFESDIEETYGVTGKLGYVSFDNILTYVLFGWQWTNIDSTIRINGDEYSDDKEFDGLSLGAGVEHQLSEGIFFRGEYSYTLYGEESIDEVDIDPHGVNFRLSMGYRF